MPRPWMLYALILGTGIAYVSLQGQMTWPQRIVFGLASALLIWRLVHKSRMAIKVDQESQGGQAAK